MDLPDLQSLMERLLPATLVASLEATLEGAEALFSQPYFDFEEDLYPQLRDLDSQIPGVGMQDVTWMDGTPMFPFSRRFEGVIRPLTYVPYYLASPMARGAMARSVIDTCGAHIEQCAKRVRGAPGRKSLGRILSTQAVSKRLGDELVHALKDVNLLWITAKHDYKSGRPESLFSLTDAIRGYFLARHLGALVLAVTSSTALHKMQADTAEAASKCRYYRKGRLPSRQQPTPDADRTSRPKPSGSHTIRVAPVEILAVPCFGDWLTSLSYPRWVASMAAIERLADYGRSLGAPEVTPMGNTAVPRVYSLEPEPPAISTQILFVFDPSDRVVLLHGDDISYTRKPRTVIRRYRSLRRSSRLLRIAELVSLSDLLGSITRVDRAEINAARTQAALATIAFNEHEMRQARERIQLDLDYLVNRPKPDVGTETLSDNWLLRHNRDISAYIGYGISVLEQLPLREPIRPATVHKADPPTAR